MTELERQDLLRKRFKLSQRRGRYRYGNAKIKLDLVEACVSSRRLTSGMVLKAILFQQWFFVRRQNSILYCWVCVVLQI